MKIKDLKKAADLNFKLSKIDEVIEAGKYGYFFNLINKSFNACVVAQDDDCGDVEKQAAIKITEALDMVRADILAQLAELGVTY